MKKTETYDEDQGFNLLTISEFFLCVIYVYSVKLEMPGGPFYYEETFFPMLVTLIVINKDPERAGQGAPDTASIPRGVRGEQNNKPYDEVFGSTQFFRIEV